MNLKTLIALAVAAAFAMPVAAQTSAGGDKSAGQQGATPPATSTPGSAASGSTSKFSQWDKNGDGFISRDEANDVTELNTRFVELDKNNDGKISASEMEAMSAGTGSTSGTPASK